MAREYETFEEFYPFYISQHQDDTCRRLHVIGTSLTLAVLVYILLNRAWSRMWVLPIVGYGFAWVGHFFFEKNKPATFQVRPAREGCARHG